MQSTAKEGSIWRLNKFQIAVILLCCLCNAADGFDVSALSVSAPLLASDWNMDPAVLGVVFTAASVGLAIGAFAIGPIAERFGRRPVMLVAIGSLAINLFLTSQATTVETLVALRFVTGLALGTLVVCLNAHVAEYAGPARNMALAILHIGFTVGMMIASTVATLVLDTLGWREVFMAASSLNALTFVLALFLIAESPAFLAKRRGPGDLERYNSLMRKLSQPEVAELPVVTASERAAAKFSLAALLAPPYRTQTILLWIAALTYSIVGYFQMQWKPTIIANAGFSPSVAASSVLVASVAGAVGHLAMGAFAGRFGERRLTAIFFAMTAVSLVLFAIQPPQIFALFTTAAMISFFLVGAYTGLFLVSVVTYPDPVKTTGLGAMVGFTRVGSAVGPMLGGFLLNIGLGRMDVYFIFSAIAVLPAIAVFMAMADARKLKAMPA